MQLELMSFIDSCPNVWPPSKTCTIGGSRTLESGTHLEEVIYWKGSLLGVLALMFLGSILRLIQKKGRTALTTFFHHYDVPPNDMGTEAIDQTIRNQEPKQTCILLSCSCELLD